MLVKIINSIFIIGAVFMGIKQGWAMFSVKPEMVEMFNKWNINKIGSMIIGSITIISALLIAFPKTFVYGNFLMASGILLMICLHLSNKDMKGVLIELPFFLLNLIIIYLKHPLAK